MSSAFDRPTLPAVGWVANLNDDDRDLLASYGEFFGIQPDHDMIKQGDEQNQLFLVISGRLEVRRIGLNDDLVLGVISAGESIGEMSLFDIGPASASIRALEFCQVWRIDKESIGSFVADSPWPATTFFTAWPPSSANASAVSPINWSKHAPSSGSPARALASRRKVLSRSTFPSMM
ncbi:MAG: cyclic nucleotide-binding domain-containing protein [Blastochloris sp.]|nr:cyclic nucleotide-binding domain-containing protein [Blastochloris sp.]